MNIKHKFALTLASGVAIGLAAEGAINAQQVKPTPGYFVGELEITDPAKFQTFVSQVPATLPPFGGHYIVRPSKVSAIEGILPRSSPSLHSTVPNRQWTGTARRPIRPSFRCDLARQRL